MLLAPGVQRGGNGTALLAAQSARCAEEGASERHGGWYRTVAVNERERGKSRWKLRLLDRGGDRGQFLAASTDHTAASCIFRRSPKPQVEMN